MYKKGFTLIELLVVIAIIGVLSSVILASLSTAKSKGANAVVKSTLVQIRTQAELSSVNGSYAALCSETIFARMVAAATSTGGGGNCYQSANAWSVVAALKTPENGNSAWCVGSSGVSKATTSVGSIVSDTDCR